MYLREGVRLAAAHDEGGVSYRTLQRWLADYWRGGLDASDEPGGTEPR
ncbi:helix-turn-helix domain-containing protein [Nonomuraea sp. CA-143628]